MARRGDDGVMVKDRQRYKRKAGLLFLSEMARTYQYLQDLLTQSEIIRFEVVDAQRVDYQYKMQNTELANSAENIDLDFATAKDIIYWPFNGEFWQDDTLAKHFTSFVRSSCTVRRVAGFLEHLVHCGALRCGMKP